MYYGAEVTRLGAISHGAELCEPIQCGSRCESDVTPLQRYRSWRRAQCYRPRHWSFNLYILEFEIDK